MPDYVVVIQRSGADGAFYVHEVLIKDADDKQDAATCAANHVMQPGDKLNDMFVVEQTIH